MPGPQVTRSSQNIGSIPRGNTWLDKGIAGYRAKKETEAAESKNMATLIAQLAQVGMIEPGGKKGDPNTVSAYGKTWTIITKPESVAEQRTKQIIRQGEKAVGNIPLEDYELAMQAREEALKIFNDPNWALRETLIRQEAKNDEDAETQIAAAKQQVYQQAYDSMLSIQKQYHPEHYQKNKPIEVAPKMDANGDIDVEATKKIKAGGKGWGNIMNDALKLLIAPDEGVSVPPGPGVRLPTLGATPAEASTGAPATTARAGTPLPSVPPWMKYGGASAATAMGIPLAKGMLATGTNAAMSGAGYGSLAGLQGVGANILPAMGKAGLGAAKLGWGGIKGLGAASKFGLTHIPHAAAIGLAGMAGFGAGRQLGQTPLMSDPNMTYDKFYQQALLNSGMFKTQAEQMNPYYQGQ